MQGKSCESLGRATNRHQTVAGNVTTRLQLKKSSSKPDRPKGVTCTKIQSRSLQGLAEALIALLPGLEDKSFTEDIQDLGTRLRAALQLFEANPPPRLLDGIDGRRKTMGARPKRGPVEGQVSYHKKCNWPGGCVKNPSFGYPGQGRERCKEHKEPDMLNVIDKLCGRTAVLWPVPLP